MSQKYLARINMLEYSIGETIDKLAVIHLKIWHLEEQIHKARTSKELHNTSDIEKLCDQVVSLNKRRLEIVQAIDNFFRKNT